MTRFLDGPAVGTHLMLRRAPCYLRAVRGPKGQWDALDQLEDRPSEDETVVAYEMSGKPNWCHIRARNGGGVYRGGDYHVVAPQPADEVLRNESAWREWARARFDSRKASAES